MATATLHEHLQAIATLVSLVNPAVCAMMFSGIVLGQSRAVAYRDATKAMVITGVVLLTAAFAGSPILKLFGISLDAFSVAGGIVLMYIGFTMLRGGSAPPTPGGGEKAGAAAGLGSLILFAASPGTITGVVTITAAHRTGAIPITAVVAIVVVLLATWALLLATARRASSSSSPGLAHDMISRYMGLIIIAMGIQFALTGYKAFMAG
jgi:multiple antibiotic resistance protein